MTAAPFRYKKVSIQKGDGITWKLSTSRSRLGATLPVGGESVTRFIPEKDRDGVPIDQGRWVEEALTVFGKLFRGATAFPPGKGYGATTNAEGSFSSNRRS